MSIYRFRSTKALLGEFRELETQQVYLAHPQQLNDPMEGYVDVTWTGQRVLWQNVLSHYLLSLHWAYPQCLLMTNEEFVPPVLDGTLTESDLLTDKMRIRFHEVRKLFLANAIVKQTLDVLIAHAGPVRRQALASCLFSVHLVAVRLLHENFAMHGLAPDVKLPSANEQALLSPDIFEKSTLTQQEFGVVWDSIDQVREQSRLRHVYNSHVQFSDRSRVKETWMLTSFVDRYLDAITGSLLHRPWRAACFSGTCTNATMWSTYADHHRGIALIFRPEINLGKQTLRLCPYTECELENTRLPDRSANGEHIDLHKVRYSDRPVSLEFFDNIGTLPETKLESTWFSDEDGNRSDRFDEFLRDRNSWRSQYWERAHDIALTKLTDWQFEDEYRIVLFDLLGEFDKNPRLRYDFASLEGIVFGLRTSDEDKVTIMDIVRKKCRASGREGFKFHQARYSARSGKLEILPMPLLDFKHRVTLKP